MLSTPGCSSLTSNLVTLNLQGKLDANYDIIAHAQPDDLTAGTARREHMRFCSNVLLKKAQIHSQEEKGKNNTLTKYFISGKFTLALMSFCNKLKFK